MPENFSPASNSDSPRWRRRLLFVIQGAVSLTLIAWLLRRVEFESIRDALEKANILLAMAGAVVFFGRHLIATFRWQLLLAALEIHYSLATLFRHYMISFFASSILPSAVAGDLGRVLLLPGARVSWVAASVAVERLAGTLALGVFAQGIFLIKSEGFAEMKAGLLIVDLLGLLGLGFLIAWFYSPRVSAAIRFRPKFLLGFVEALKIYRRPGPLLFQTFLLSLFNQGFGILGILLFGRAIGDATTAWIYFALLPGVWLFSLIPISIGGFGLREGALVYLFTQVGSTDVHANLLALFMLVMTLFQAGVGAFLAPFEGSRYRRRKDEPQGSA